MISDIHYKKYSIEEINENIEKIIIHSLFKIKNKSTKKNPYIYKIEDVARKINVYFICKNVTSSGWSDKPGIVRIQIKNISEIFIYTNKNETMLISGLCMYKDKIILIVWNAYRYMNHKTNRSCYANVEMLENCYNKGYFFSRDFDQEIWLCDEWHFNLLIRDYVLFTYGNE